MAWNQIQSSYPSVLRGTNQQTATGLLWQPPSMVSVSSSRITGTIDRATFREGVAIRRFTLHNRSGGTASCGIGFRLQNRFWVAGQITAAGVFTDDTADAQSATANDFPLGANAVNDGFVIASPVPFGWVSINVGTAEVDAAAADLDHAVSYSNAAGTGWTALGSNAALTDQFTTTNAVYATGALEFVWLPPSDWGKVTAISTIPVGWYALRVLAASTAVNDTAALANTIEVGTLQAVEGVVDNGLLAQDWTTYSEPKADAVVAYFSTANAGNYVIAEVTTS